MTVTYTAEVATCRGFGCFVKLLFRWRGSIYKLVWPDLTVFLLLYYSLNLTYIYWLEEHQRKHFENIVKYCAAFSDLIPLSFVLGFYVSIVMTRWWNQYVSIPWPDSIAVFVSANIHGQDERGRVMRRTILRYVCLCFTMVLSMISPRVKKRFPRLQNFVEAGLLTENEQNIMQALNEKSPRHSKHWLPIVWAASIVTRARKEGRIRDDFAVKTIIDELNKFRGQCGLLLSYDTISIPLVYTQVVTLAVYSYFCTCVLARQHLDVDNPTDSATLYKTGNIIDKFFPLFTTLQFFFYMGWLKVAETLINPFGDDDDDFEVNWLVDRNLQVSYLIVDEMHHEHPELIKDQYWDEVFPTELPYTQAASAFREEPPNPSTANIAAEPAKIDEMGDRVYDDTLSGIHFSANPKSRMSRTSTRERLASPGSISSINTNMGSIAGSLPRVSSVTSVLRRIFPRDGTGTSTTNIVTATTGSATTDGVGGRLPVSNSSASLVSKFAPGGSIRITDQVIEEVDEQSTVTSTRPPEYKPSVLNIFPQSGPPPPSSPMNVPQSSFRRNHPDLHGDIPPLSSSAPTTAGITLHSNTVSPAPSSNLFTEVMSVHSAPDQPGRHLSQTDDTVSIGGSSTSSGCDEFSRLKATRDKERKLKLMVKLARSISAQQGNITPVDTDNDQLLMDLSTSSRVALVQPSPRSSAFGDHAV